MLRQLSAFWEGFLQFSNQINQKIENFITERQEGRDSDVIFMKKMLLKYSYFVSLYLLCILLFSLDFTMRKWLPYIFFPICQVLALNLSNRTFDVIYFMVYALFGLFFYNGKDLDSLRQIGIAFLSHQQFFFSMKDIQLKRFFVLLSFLIFVMLGFTILSEPDYSFEEFENSFKISKFIVIILYLPNYLCSTYKQDDRHPTLQSSYQLAKNQEAIEFDTKQKEKLNTALSQVFDLEKENLDLKNDLQARELFIASFSHEIRNSLNAIIGNIELLKLEIINEKWQKQLDVCKVIGEVMLDQTNDVLDMAKINAEKMELNYTPEDFLKVIEKMWSISIIRIKQKRLRAELYISSTFPRYIEIDPHRITQILLNLIGNASKFTDSGFVKIILSWHENRDIETLKSPNQEFLRLVENANYKNNLGSNMQELEFPLVETGNEQPDISTIECLHSPYTLNLRAEIERRRFSPRMMSQMLASNSIFISSDHERAISKMHTKYTYRPKTKGIVKIEVIDTGCGMSRTNMQKLFQPFIQADSSISYKFGGTGLGLYITKKIVEAMNGKIQVYSQQNVGSNFCVLIPVSTGDEEEYFQKQLSNLQTRIGNKVLEQMNMMVIASPHLEEEIIPLVNYLKGLSINIEIAKDTQDAFRIYKSKSFSHYSFMIMDVSQLNFCKLIRKYEKDHQDTQKIPIILLSEQLAEKEKESYLDQNGDIQASAVYQLPVIVEEFKNTIEDIIQKKRKINASKERLPKILVVDDDPFNTSIIQEYMKKNNIECVVCSSGKEAIGKTYKEKFNVILMDLEMPGMDGFTAAKLIREKYSDIVILGMTGHRKDKVLQKAKEHGMNNIETKPLDFKKILGIILGALN